MFDKVRDFLKKPHRAIKMPLAKGKEDKKLATIIDMTPKEEVFTDEEKTI